VVPWPFPDALSALVVALAPDSFAIGVNRLHHRNRRRFSVAHELGHALLRHKAGYYLEFSDPTAFGEPPNYHYEDERAANVFAASLLMDARWVRADFRNGTTDVTELAYRYRVSEEAMSFRLLNLGLA
jgi:Zn-dependent peptidase ImmA (M78 family)